MSDNVEKEMITISKKEYLELKEDSAFLSCLEYYGVDNWEFYYEAQEKFDTEYTSEE